MRWRFSALYSIVAWPSTAMRLRWREPATITSRPFDTSVSYWPLSWLWLWPALSYCRAWTTVTLCCMEPRPAASRNCSASRTQQHALFFKCLDDRLLSRSWNSFTGFLFVNDSTTNLQFSHTISAAHPRRHTSAVTSDLGNLLVTSALPQLRYCTSRPPELALLIVLSVAWHPPFGTL